MPMIFFVRFSHYSLTFFYAVRRSRIN